MAPLLYWHFKDGNWPDEMLQAVRDTGLQGSYYKTAARNAVLFSELERILEAFEEAGIPVIVLKGAAFLLEHQDDMAQTLYPDPGLRPMGDLDLLVKHDDAPKVVNLLMVQQYKPLYVTSHHVGFAKPNNKNVVIELHYEIPIEKENRTLISAKWFWKETEQKNENQSIFSLTPIAQFIYLLGHVFVTHQTNYKLIWLYDLYLSYHSEIVYRDWDDVRLKIKNAQLETEFQEFLTELRKLFLQDSNQQINSKTQWNKSRIDVVIDKRLQPRFVSVWMILEAFNWKTRIKLLGEIIFLNKEKTLRMYHPQKEALWPIYAIYRLFNIGIEMIYHQVFKKS